MCDEWMPTVRVKMTLQEFRQLPRNPAYRYEYLEGEALLSPRSRHYHAVLALAPSQGIDAPEADDKVILRPVHLDDLPALEDVFAGAFHCIQPFGGLDEATRKEAAHRCLQRTVSGGDGPWVQRASIVALAEEDSRPVGATFITLLPDGDPCEYASYYWNEPPPDELLERGLGRPHLTWIFVAPLRAGCGTGSALLGAAAAELLTLGYDRLFSTFLLGNESSLLWHWRCGFRLLSHPGSMRRMRRQLRKGGS
jgi:GNAT superfamily N-acetyltransferase